MLSQVQLEFVLLKEETKSINKNIAELIALNKSMQAMQVSKNLEPKFSNASLKSNVSWSAWTWNYTHWVARKTGVNAVYRYFVPKQAES